MTDMTGATQVQCSAAKLLVSIIPTSLPLDHLIARNACQQGPEQNRHKSGFQVVKRRD